MALSVEYNGESITVRSSGVKVIITKDGELDVIDTESSKRIDGVERLQAIRSMKLECAEMQRFWTTVLSSNIDKILDGILSVD